MTMAMATFDYFVAGASHGFQSTPIYDFNIAAVVINDLARFQNMGRLANTHPADTQHGAQEFLTDVTQPP